MKSNKKRKPLIVYFHRYPPEYEAEQFPIMRNMFDALLKDYDVVYYSMRYPGKPDLLLRKGLCMMEVPFEIDRINAKDKWIKTILFYFYLPIALWKMRKLKPQIIIPKETLPFIPSIVGLLNKPMFMEVSDWWWSIIFGKTFLGSKLAKFLERIEVKQWARKKNLIVAHTKTEANIVAKKGMPMGRIRIINAPLYEKIYYPCNANDVRKKLEFTKKNFVVALHGIIHPSKGYDQILKWWKKVVAIHPDWKLLIIGGSGMESWCRNEIKNLNLESNVIMTGWLPTQQEVNRYLNAANCLLVTRRNTENNAGIIPSSLYHSMPTGKPTLATGLGGMSEIIKHGVCGYLYKPDSYESFKDVLEYVAANPKNALRVGRAGIKRAEECFSPKRAVRLYEKLVEDLLHKYA